MKIPRQEVGMLRCLSILTIATALLFIPLQAARAAVDVTPFIGASVPTKSLYIQVSGATLIRNKTNTVYGLGVATSVSKRLDAEVILGAGTGSLEVVSTTALELASTLLFADLRGKFRIAGNDQAHLGLVGGVGYTTQKIGLFDYADLTGSGEFKAKLTGILGVSFGAALSDRLHLSMEMVDRIREQGIVVEGATGLTEPTQHDVTVTAGLSFPITK
jgi:hypothetical protein